MYMIIIRRTPERMEEQSANQWVSSPPPIQVLAGLAGGGCRPGAWCDEGEMVAAMALRWSRWLSVNSMLLPSSSLPRYRVRKYLLKISRSLGLGLDLEVLSCRVSVF